MPAQGTRCDAGRVDRLQLDGADIEHQALRDGVLGKTFGLSLHPDDEIVRVQICVSTRVARQRNCDRYGFGPDVGPEDRPEPSSVTVTKELADVAGGIDDRTICLVADEPRDRVAHNGRRDSAYGVGMRVLVTGGAGYIGSHTVIQLIAAGHDVLIVDS